MSVEDALRAVAVIEPVVLIPVQDNWDILFYHHAADVERFVAAVRAEGRQCPSLGPEEDAEV